MSLRQTCCHDCIAVKETYWSDLIPACVKTKDINIKKTTAGEQAVNHIKAEESVTISTDWSNLWLNSKNNLMNQSNVVVIDKPAQ